MGTLKLCLLMWLISSAGVSTSHQGLAPVLSLEDELEQLR